MVSPRSSPADVDGRPDDHLADGDDDHRSAAGAEGGADGDDGGRIAPGARVRLTGLQNAPELNGKRGVVEVCRSRDLFSRSRDDGERPVESVAGPDLASVFCVRDDGESRWSNDDDDDDAV